MSRLLQGTAKRYLIDFVPVEQEVRASRAEREIDVVFNTMCDDVDNFIL